MHHGHFARIVVVSMLAVPTFSGAAVAENVTTITINGVPPATAAPAAAAKFSVLYTFTGGTDGGPLFRGVTADSSGRILYGASSGGAQKCSGVTIDGYCGLVFSLTRTASGPWRKKTLHTFAGGRDGVAPLTVQFLDATSTLYGITEAGGDKSCNCGTVYSLTPPATEPGKWTKTALHDFKGGPRDGRYPASPLLMDADGAIYGTTISGGNTPEGGKCFSFRTGCGTVFKITAPQSGTQWPSTLVHTFSGGPDGADPDGVGLIANPDGGYFGTAVAGGNVNCPSPLLGAQSGCGTVYLLTPPAPGGKRWKLTVLHAFKGGRRDGNSPVASTLTMDNAGNLYGTTEVGGDTSCRLTPNHLGCGTIFKLSPPTSGNRWTFTLLYSFTGGADGAEPLAGLVLRSGVLYGTTFEGGNLKACDSGCGTVFSFTLGAKTPVTLHTFNGTDGRGPLGSLASLGKALVGVTRNGGDSTACTDVNGSASGCGTVFMIVP